jgi:phosphoglycerate dehydrogenase-like enzyme
VTTYDVMISTPLDPDLVALVGRHPAVRLHYDAGLLPPPRYPCDHRGDPTFTRTPAGERRWQQMLARAEVLYGIPGDTPEDLAAVIRDCPRLRLIQATSAGAAEQVAAAELTVHDLQRVAITTASGVHAGPLAEFAILAVLRFTRHLHRIETDQAHTRWDHYATADLAGERIVILGTGAIGTQTARVAHALGMRTVGVNTRGGSPAEPFDELYSSNGLAATVNDARALVITAPLTDTTREIVDATVLRALPADAIVINVGRGAIIDEAALVRSLQAKEIGGAALDVTTDEPLPPDSPLWTMPNVLISPHTAALSPRENERIVEIFLDNISRLAAATPARNRINAAGG